VNSEITLGLANLRTSILDLGYSETTADMVIAFLKTQKGEIHMQEQMVQVLPAIQSFIDKRLKPRYLASKVDRLLALIDITAEPRETAIYFTKHLFDPKSESSRLRLEYARIRRLSDSTYAIGIPDNDKYKTLYLELSLEECLNYLESDPLLVP
jgi:hypothetical protein